MNETRNHIIAATAYAALTLFSTCPAVILVLRRVPVSAGYAIYLGTATMVIVSTTLVVGRVRKAVNSYGRRKTSRPTDNNVA